MDQRYILISFHLIYDLTFLHWNTYDRYCIQIYYVSVPNDRKPLSYYKLVFIFLWLKKKGLEVVNKIIQTFGFELAPVWPYDPHHIISNLRISFHSSTYNHHSKPDLEMLANKDKWEGSSNDY